MQSFPPVHRTPVRPEEPREISCFSYIIYSLEPKMFKFVVIMTFACVLAAGIIIMFLGSWLYNGWWMIFSFIFTAFAIIPDLFLNRLPTSRSSSAKRQMKVYVRDVAFTVSGFCYFSAFAIILVFAHVGVITVRAMAMGLSSTFIILTAVSLFMKLYVNGEFQHIISCFHDSAEDSADDDPDTIFT